MMFLVVKRARLCFDESQNFYCFKVIAHVLIEISNIKFTNLLPMNATVSLLKLVQNMNKSFKVFSETFW